MTHSQNTSRKPKSNKPVPPNQRYNGPIYLPKHIHNMLSDDVKKELDKYNQEKMLNTSLLVPGQPRSMSKIMMRLNTQNTQSLTLKTISQMTHIPCKTQTLKTFSNHMAFAQPKWHLHITSPSTLLPPVGL